MNRKQLEEEIQSITRQLIKKCKPQQIILFGSAARGEFGPDSDLDFLIVKRTQKRPIERRWDIVRSVKPKIAADFLVYTPEELAYEKKIGDFFIEEVLSEGRILHGKT